MKTYRITAEIVTTLSEDHPNYGMITGLPPETVAAVQSEILYDAIVEGFLGGGLGEGESIDITVEQG